MNLKHDTFMKVIVRINMYSFNLLLIRFALLIIRGSCLRVDPLCQYWLTRGLCCCSRRPLLSAVCCAHTRVTQFYAEMFVSLSSRKTLQLRTPRLPGVLLRDCISSEPRDHPFCCLHALRQQLVCFATATLKSYLRRVLKL